MRFLTLAMLALLLAQHPREATAVSAAPITVELQQDDGSTFTARPAGDEYTNWMETIDGYSVIQQAGAWYYARLLPNGTLGPSANRVGTLPPGQLRQLAKHLYPAEVPGLREVHVPRKLGTGGGRSLTHTQRVLTILVDFSDVSFTYSDASFQSLMYGATDSVREFYLENSYGTFSVEPATEGYGTADDGIVHVAMGTAHPNGGSTSNYAWNTVAGSYIAAADPFVNFASFDTNGNGLLSASEVSIVIILAGYENSYGGTSSLTPRVWGHKWNLSSEITLDSKNLSPYTMFGESHATSLGNKHQSTIGIMCHELGHLMLGLPDLYDTDSSSSGIGDWCAMSGGSWNTTGTWSGETPSHLSAWCKTALDITTPIDVDSMVSGASVLQGSANPDVKRIWLDKYKSPISEHFLIENRQQTGYDSGLPGNGLLIWHVDKTRTANQNEAHKMVDLEEADGLAQLDANTNDGDTGDTFPGSTNNTSFTDSSTPNSRNYLDETTDAAVTAISASGATMTATFTPATDVDGGDSVAYDERGYTGWSFSFFETMWTAVRYTNTTSLGALEGFEVYTRPDVVSTIDFYLYQSIPGGVRTGLLYTETGFSGSGWNRFLLTTPQSFPPSSDRVIVLRIFTPGNNSRAYYDDGGVISSRCYYDNNDTGAMANITSSSAFGDFNQHALLGEDNTAPSVVSITPATVGPTNATSVAFTVLFSEWATGFNAASDVTINHTGTANSGVTITGGPQTYTATVTGVSGNGSFTLAVNTGSDVDDTSGNPLATTVTSAAVTIDQTQPTVSMSSAAPNPTSGSPIAVSVSFSESVTGFTSGDISATNGTVSSFSGSGSSYSFNLTPSGQGTVSANINGSVCIDAAGNSNTAATSFSRVFDSVAPTVTMTSGASNPTASSPIAVSVSFSESVTGFTSGDISPGNATVGNFSGSGSSYSFDLTPSGQGTVTANISAGVSVDAAGNGNSAASQFSRTFDSIAPTVSMTSGASNPTASSPIAISVTFSESVTGFASGDISATNGTVSGLSGSGASYSFNLTPSGQGTVSANINGGVCADAAGNGNTAAAEFSRVYDSVGPTVAMTSVASNPTASSPIAVSVIFSESVTGFTSGDISPGNAAVSNFAGSGSSYSFDLTPSGQGTVTANISAGVSVDGAGNGNSAAPQFTRVFDSAAPTVVLSSSASNPTGVTPIPVDVVFSESVTGFVAGDVTAGNATVSGFTGSGTSYSFNLVPAGEGAVTASVGAGSAQDAAGNGNIASAQFSRTFTIAPVIVAIADDSVSDGATYTSVVPSLSAGSGPIVWTLIAPASPPGDMEIDGDTGQVTWTADYAESPVNVTIRATGPGGTDEEFWIVTVDAVAPVIDPIADLTIEDGANYSVVPSLSQGTTPITWTLVAPASPPGDMEIDEATGEVTWTANFAFSPVDITVMASGPEGSDTESWSITINPLEIWVDFGYTGVELGTVAQPFNTLAEAIAAAGAEDTITIKGDSSVPFTLETLVVGSPVRIEAQGGSVRIGGSFGGGGRAPGSAQTGFVTRKNK